jgi:hypothetical protein
VKLTTRIATWTAALALLVPGGFIAAAGAAGAATPSCGSTCIDVFSKQFGTFDHPGFVLDTFRQGEKTGQPQILFRTANSDPAEDYSASFQGLVSDFFAAGLVSAAVELHYGGSINVTEPAGDPVYPDDPAFEDQYAPFGVDSGLCVWILDIPIHRLQLSDGCPLNPLYYLEAPLINGSDTNFSQPFVLTYPNSAFPTDKPRPQLTVTNLTGFAQDGVPGNVCGTDSIAGPDSSQEWAAVGGVLNS